MKRYIRSRHLEVEERSGDEVVLTHGLLGTRLRLNAPAGRFLSLFDSPHALEDLDHLGSLEKARPIFERLCGASFLVEEGHEENITDKVVQKAQRGFFGCPPLTAAGETPDYAFLGVPFDHGNHEEPGARFAPDEMRAVSCSLHFHYAADPATGKAAGWHDNDLDRPVLTGAALADAGNVFIVPGESPTHVFDKIRGVVTGLLGRGTLPVIVGGDHSITYPILTAYREPLGIFHLDAHSDMAPYHAGVENHHGNVMSRVVELGHVRAIHQVGLRGTTAISQLRSRPGRTRLSPAMLRALGVDGLLERVPDDLPLYVSVDIDALDPACAPGTSTPVPGGLGFEEAKRILAAIGERRRCVGFDLVEVNPKKDVNRITSHVALELLLAFLGAHFEARRARHG